MPLQRFQSRFLAILFVALGGCAVPAHAQGVLPVPALEARVIDQTGTLDDIQRQGLESKLASLEKEKGSQIVVLLVPTTQPEDIAVYANRVANEWKVGRKGVGDGVLLIVAKNDRRVRIEVAKTLEGAIPDLAASRVIEEAITPRFREGDFAGGLHAGVDRLIGLVKGEPLPAPKREGSFGAGDAEVQWFALAAFLLFILPVAGGILRAIFGRKLGALAAGAAAGGVAFFMANSWVLAAVAGVIALVFVFVAGAAGNFVPVGRQSGWRTRDGFGGGNWGSGGWSSSGGGGGFSTGGGGNFGGGGASGNW